MIRCPSRPHQLSHPTLDIYTFAPFPQNPERDWGFNPTRLHDQLFSIFFRMSSRVPSRHPLQLVHRNSTAHAPGTRLRINASAVGGSYQGPADGTRGEYTYALSRGYLVCSDVNRERSPFGSVPSRGSPHLAASAIPVNI